MWCSHSAHLPPGIPQSPPMKSCATFTTQSYATCPVKSFPISHGISLFFSVVEFKKIINFGSRKAWFKFQLCHLLVTFSWLKRDDGKKERKGGIDR